MDVSPAGRWSRLSPPQRFVVVLIPIGVVLALALSLLDSVPSLAKSTSIRLGLYDDVRGGILGLHPWTWAHFLGWLALAASIAVALVGVRRAVQAGFALFAGSIIIEIMQDRLTSQRGFSVEDIWANGLGVAAGVALGLGVTQLWLRREVQLTDR